MKPDLHGPKAGASKQKVSKTKVLLAGRVEDEASQSRMSKQIKINKSKNMKSPSSVISKKKHPSSVKSYAKEVNGNSTTKKSTKENLDSVSPKEDKSRKRKREEQKKPKSNRKKSVNEEAKHKKNKIVEAKNSNSGMISPVQPPSQKKSAESRAKEHVKPKKPKTTAGAKTTARKPSSSTGAKLSKTSVKGSKSLKSEQGKKKLIENGTHKKLKPHCLKSKRETSAKRRDSFSRKEEAGSSRSKGHTKIAVQKKPRPNSRANSVKIHSSHKDVKKKTSKATGHEPTTTLVENTRSSNARRMKVLRALGLAPPVGSPFIRLGAIL